MIWEAGEERCISEFADLDDPCEAASARNLTCNPRGNLECDQRRKVCVCDSKSEPDSDGFKYCRRRATVWGYNEHCHELYSTCNAELNLTCDNGVCVCIVDEMIEDTGTDCIEKQKNDKDEKKSSGSTLKLRRDLVGLSILFVQLVLL
jgi:hypothetical protein